LGFIEKSYKPKFFVGCRPCNFHHLQISFSLPMSCCLVPSLHPSSSASYLNVSCLLADSMFGLTEYQRKCFEFQHTTKILIVQIDKICTFKYNFKSPNSKLTRDGSVSTEEVHGNKDIGYINFWNIYFFVLMKKNGYALTKDKL